MELEIDCECGEPISEFTRGADSNFDTRVECDECGNVYAVTITPIGP